LACFSSQVKEKKKNYRKEKNAKKRGSFPSSSCYALSFFTPTSAFSLLPFCFKRFLQASSSSQAEEKKKTKEKTSWRRKKM